jgi:hypothetical protein
MAVTFTLDMPGMTREQLDGLVQRLGAGPGNVPDGQIAHIESITDDGVRITDVWESAEAYERFMQERLGPIFAEAGMPSLDMPPMLEVHRVFVAEVGPAAP